MFNKSKSILESKPQLKELVFGIVAIVGFHNASYLIFKLPMYPLEVKRFFLYILISLIMFLYLKKYFLHLKHAFLSGEISITRKIFCIAFILSIGTTIAQLLMVFMTPMYEVSMGYTLLFDTRTVMALLSSAAFFFFILSVSIKILGYVSTDTHGSARWAGKKEFENIFNKNNTGLAVNGVERISEKLSFQNMAVVAPSGFGKTQTFVIPNIILSGVHDRSIVVTDPSGEIFKTTAGYMKSKGYEIKLLEPFSTKTDFYNPIQNVKTLSDAKIVSDTILRQIESKGNPFWHTAASKLMSGLILLLRKTSDMKNKNYMSIVNIKRLLTLKSEELEQLLNEEELEDVKIELASFLKSNDDTRSGVEMTLDSALSLFSDAHFSDITAQHSIHFEELREKKTIVYVIVPESKIKYSAPFLSVFYKQLFENLLLTDSGLPVYVLLDEFGNMGCIPDFSNIITTSRKRNISISMILQEIDQVKSIYGKDHFQTIFNGGCVSKTYYPGLGLETCKYISELLDDTTVHTVSSNSEGGDTVSDAKRRLLNPDEVRQLEENNIIFVSSNNRPIVLNTVRSYKNKSIQEKLSDVKDYVFTPQKETIKTEKVTL